MKSGKTAKPDQDLRQWLTSLGLDQYADALEHDDVTLELLSDLSEDDLRTLGLTLGHRKKLLKAIGRLQSSTPNPNAVASQGPAKPTREAERRQLTVLFCDLVGSTQLSQQLDAEDLRALMQRYQTACRGVIESYDGYIAQFLGDGIMAYFGWPSAHEDDGERAVRSALEIISAVKQIKVPRPLCVHLGVATGPVVVGEDAGEDATAPKLAVGETPNLAARLQSLAGSDEIMVAPATHRLLGQRFLYQDLGERALKGIVNPVQVWQVVKLSGIEGRFEATRAPQLSALVGRHEELQLLLRRWQQAKGGEGQVVLLSGEAGIGKSRISQTLLATIGNEPHIRLRYQCSPYHINSAFYPIIEQLHKAADFNPDDSAEQKLVKIEQLMAAVQIDNPRTVPLIVILLGVSMSDKYPPLDYTPQRQRDETIRVLTQYLTAVATRSPVLVLLEDAHWLDPSSLEAFDQFIQQVATQPILLLVTFRPDFAHKWTGQGHVTQLTLNRFGRQEAAELVRRVAGEERLSDEIIELIAAKTDGVPLFVEELTKTVLESGLLVGPRDGAQPAIAIPSTLHDSLKARLDRLGPVKEVAQIAACIGREFGYELLSTISPLSQTDLKQALDQLLAAEIVFRRGAASEATFSFKHALLQDAAYESLLKSRRAQLHASIAASLQKRFPETVNTQPELLAQHYTRAGLPERAIYFWCKAGELGLARMALTEAIAHLKRGLELIELLPVSRERDSSEVDLRIMLGRAWQALKGWPAQEVWNCFHRGLVLTKSLCRHDALLPILFPLWNYVLGRGRVAESLDWVEQMFAAAEANQQPDLRIAGHVAAMVSYSFLGELSKARNHSDDLESLYSEERHGHLAAIVNTDVKTAVGLYRSHWTWMLGYPDQAVKISDAKDVLARHRGHPLNLGWALTTGADVFDFRCEPKELRKRAEEADRVGRENSLPFLYACLVPRCYGIALIREGKPEEGIPLLKAGIEKWDESGGYLNSPYRKSVLAEAMAQVGDVDGALHLINDMLTQVERPGWQERIHYAEILRLKGWMLCHKADVEGAERYYLASLEWARYQQAKSWELRTASSYARLMKAQGRREKALHLLRPIYSWFTEGFDTRDLREAKALLDDLA